MQLFQHNEHFISTVDTDALVLYGSRASVTTVLSRQCVSSYLGGKWVCSVNDYSPLNITHLTLYSACGCRWPSTVICYAISRHSHDKVWSLLLQGAPFNGLSIVLLTYKLYYSILTFRDHILLTDISRAKDVLPLGNRIIFHFCWLIRNMHLPNLQGVNVVTILLDSRPSLPQLSLKPEDIEACTLTPSIVHIG